MHLLLSKNSDNLKLISEIYELNNLIPFLDTTHYIHNNEDIYLCLDKEQLTEQDIVSSIKKRKYDKIKIFCINSIKFPKINNIELNIYNLNDIFKEISQKDVKLKEQINIEKSPKLTAKDYFCIIFNKDRSRAYFGFGFLLLFSSLFTPFHTYYIVVGTILILASIYSRFNKIFN